MFISCFYVPPVLLINFHLHPHLPRRWRSAIAKGGIRLDGVVSREGDGAREGVNSAKEKLEVSVGGCRSVLGDH